MFTIRPGIYHIPNFGKLDTRKKVSNKDLITLYENKDFPFIKPTRNAIEILKKEKLSEKRVLYLIDEATSKEEVEILLEVKSTKKIQAFSKIKLECFS